MPRWAYYQSKDWRVLRAAVLRESPLCVACKAFGRLVAAGVVDHVVPLKDGGARFDRPTCSLSASLATTARRPEDCWQALDPLPTGRGVKSLRLGGADAPRLPEFLRVQTEKLFWTTQCHNLPLEQAYSGRIQGRDRKARVQCQRGSRGEAGRHVPGPGRRICAQWTCLSFRSL
jgi:hypothetical protein